MTKNELIELMQAARKSEDSFTMMQALQQIAVTMTHQYASDKDIRREYNLLHEKAFETEGGE